MEFHINMTGRCAVASDSHAYVRGTAFIGSDTSTPLNLLGYFDRIESEYEFRSSMILLNGFFAVVCNKGSVLLAGVDRIRSIPLFYGATGDEFYISDDASWVQTKVGSFQRSELSEREFCMTGYVTGSETLYPGVKQLRAGELLVAKTADGLVQFSTERYFDFVGRPETSSDAETLSHELDALLIRCFERLLRLADGRTLVVPLSGGYDSRLIVLMLKRLGYENVVAFTYGRPGNTESEISKQVAKRLDIPWQFVPYSNELWWQWFRTEEREAYYAMAHHAVSVPHLQDWPAVWELKRRGLVAEDSVFVPGHAADMISGSHIPEAFVKARQVSHEQLVEQIFKKHYSLVRVPRGKDLIFLDEMKGRITSALCAPDCLVPDVAVRLSENWNWQERQAKFIANSVRVYEFWGYDWWLPFWDQEMFDFWARVPLEHRIGQRLYIAYVKKLTAETLGDKSVSALVTDRELSTSRLKEFIRMTPLRGFAKWVYRKLKTSNYEYENHPRAWYGIMSREVFRRYHVDRYESINSFLAMDILGAIDLMDSGS